MISGSALAILVHMKSWRKRNNHLRRRILAYAIGWLKLLSLCRLSISVMVENSAVATKENREVVLSHIDIEWLTCFSIIIKLFQTPVEDSGPFCKVKHWTSEVFEISSCYLQIKKNFGLAQVQRRKMCVDCTDLQLKLPKSENKLLWKFVLYCILVLHTFFLIVASFS